MGEPAPRVHNTRQGERDTIRNHPHEAMMPKALHDLEEMFARSTGEGPRAANTTAVGSTLTAVIKHGGFQILSDVATVRERIKTNAQLAAPGVLTAFAETPEGDAIIAALAAIPVQFFYHIVDNPYELHSGLVSYLTFPNEHLRSPLPTTSYRPVGKTYAKGNTPSPEIPAAMTFVGQFIDHDLTLNAMNLFDDQGGQVPSEASPLIDLDSVYGPRIDDKDPAHGNREIPMDDGKFKLRKIPGGFDVCRKNKNIFGQTAVASIGDKRNDENQIILQIHLLLMRLHNTFRADGLSCEDAKKETILHWQSVVATEYLRLVCDPPVVDEVTHRLMTSPNTLVYQAQANGPAGPSPYRMPHEFAIGFRFGHSQLRSRYRLNPQREFRLFDSLSDGHDDLQGGKCLTPDRLIDWPYFLHKTGGAADLPSNLIDTHVNEVVFDLPESTIPDELTTLVSNLPFRNLTRSHKVGLCAGEDLAARYQRSYPGVVPLTDAQVEPAAEYRNLFKVNTGGKFRTPLWYYLLREAEVARESAGHWRGQLGALGSHLVAEVILSAIWNATPSYLQDAGWTARIPTDSGDPRKVRLIDIANYVIAKDAPAPGCGQQDACGTS